MIDIVLCIGLEHDPWLVGLAVLICSVGALAIVQLFERARRTSGVQRFGWAFLTSIAAGATIWCTHFVAMLAFKAGVPITLDPVLTIASLAVAIVGTLAGITVAARGDNSIYGTIGGAIFGGAISAMHFMGMTAYRVDGIVTWERGYVATSIVCAIVFGGAAFTVLRRSKIERRRIAVGTALIVTAIATLHFVAMTAMNVEPLALSATPLEAGDLRALAFATALVGAMVIATGIFATLIDRQNRSDTARKLAYMAHNDSLTGLPNRAWFKSELARRVHAARETGAAVGLFAIDVSRFKEINDFHGHKAGDDVLVLLARRLRSVLGPDDLVARSGGNEFVMLTHVDDRDELTNFAERLDAEIRVPLWIGHFEARLRASIGMAVLPTDAQDAETLIQNATLAMSRAKTEGSPGPRLYDPVLDEATRDRRELASDLRQAIRKDELEVHYQVQVKATTGAVTGYEALLRWNHPKRGAISPVVFIPIAEQNGFILELGEWVLRRACADAAHMDPEVKIAVNVSALQLAQVDLTALVVEVLLETGLPPRRLEIELTETAIMVDRNRALHVLRQIKALGVGVALDDFGTGYSSLQTLRAFPFDKIKLDGFFAAELGANPQSTAILRAVLALGKSLSIPVLAEGVETREQFEILLREGCDKIQGFLFGRPEPFAQTTSRAISKSRRSSKPKVRNAVKLGVQAL